MTLAYAARQRVKAVGVDDSCTCQTGLGLSVRSRPWFRRIAAQMRPSMRSCCSNVRRRNPSTSYVFLRELFCSDFVAVRFESRKISIRTH